MGHNSFDKVNNKALILVNVILGQTFLAIFLAAYQRLWLPTSSQSQILNKIPVTFLISVGTLILAVTAVWLIRVLLNLAVKEAQAEANEARLEESKEFIEVLRSHRHDFMNHLQVISGLIDLGMPDKAKGYVLELADELKGDQALHLVEHPELNALFIKKWAVAEQHGVDISLESTADLRGIAIPSHELTRILGNLIENAIQAATGVAPGERKVHMRLWTEQDRSVIEVGNWRPVIAPELQDKIFQRGFSTKDSTGRGLGLDIVHGLIGKHGGELQLVSTPETGTVFTVSLPNNNQEDRRAV